MPPRPLRPPPRVGSLPLAFDFDFDLALAATFLAGARLGAGAAGGGIIMGIPPPPCRLTGFFFAFIGSTFSFCNLTLVSELSYEGRWGLLIWRS